MTMIGNNCHLETYQTPELTLRAAQEGINNLLAKVSQEQLPYLLLLSAGSAFDILPGINPSYLSAQTTYAVLDERYSLDKTINNAMQLRDLPFFTILEKQKAFFIDTTPLEKETSDALANRFKTSLFAWKKEHPQGVILATLGIGPDGHTSGIMPFPENPSLFKALFENTNIIASYDATGKNPYPNRITTTITFLKEYITYGICYVVGKNKQSALQRLVASEGDLSTTPCRILRDMKHVTIYTDVSLE